MLVSVGQIEKRSFDGIPVDWTGNRDAIQAVIDGVVDRIETYLGRPLELATYKQYADHPKNKWLAIVKPVISVQSDKVERQSPFEIVLKVDAEELEYTAGYTFETLPRDILMVIYRLTAFELNKAMVNDYGVTTKTVTTGSTTANITKEAGDYEQEQLESLSKYRNMQFYDSIQKIP